MRFSKHIFSSIVLLLTGLMLFGCSQQEESKAKQSQINNQLVMTVYKDRNCGCCRKWILHMKQQGFLVASENSSNLSEIKQEYKISPKNRSCHTAVTESGFVFEGHIPARYIKRFLEKPPEMAAGLTVPGMPIGTPGMEIGDRFAPYTVMQINEDGTSLLFAEVKTYEEQF